MRKRWVVVALVSMAAIALLATSSSAISRWGDIGGGLSYDALQIDGGRGSCTISGIIKNNTRTLLDGVYIKIYAWDNFDRLEWSHILFIKAIEAGGEWRFAERIYDCDERNPYKLTFQVTK